MEVDMAVCEFAIKTLDGDLDHGLYSYLSVYGDMVNYKHAMILYGDEQRERIVIGNRFAAEVFNETAVLVAWGLWGVKPATLYRSCERLGIHRVVATIREIMPKTGINNPGAFLNKCLSGMS
jgi:hypothetical protein